MTRYLFLTAAVCAVLSAGDGLAAVSAEEAARLKTESL